MDIPHQPDYGGNLPDASELTQADLETVLTPASELLVSVAEEPPDSQPRRSSRTKKAPDRLTYQKPGQQESNQPASESQSNSEPLPAEPVLASKSVQSDSPQPRNYMSVTALGRTPESYHEMLTMPEAELWKKSMSAEYQSILKHDTFIWTPLPKGRKPIQSKWVYKLKPDPKALSKKKYKSRLCAKGFTQIQGKDYDEVFAPVMKQKSLRMLVCHAAQNDWHLHQMDVSTTFLHGELEEEVYLLPPPGIETPKGCEDHVWKLQKALYGLKQSPRCWNLRLHRFLVSLGFSMAENDHAVYYKGTGDDQIIITVYVDDLILASYLLAEILAAKEHLSNEFEMKDLGPVQTVLGINVFRDWDKHSITLSQLDYINDLLWKFGQEPGYGKITPLVPGEPLSANDSPKTEREKDEMADIPYAGLVGSLIYLASCTRPDLAFAVSTLSRFMANPGMAHWKAAQRTLQYIKKTKNWGLTYCKREGGIKTEGYVDASWGPGPDDRLSQGAYFYNMGGAAVVWHNKRLQGTAQSSTESEYSAVGLAAMELNWMWNLLEELGWNPQEPIQLHCDSQSSMNLLANPVYHERTKHFEVKWHYAREKIQEKKLKMSFVGTKTQCADALTKALPGPQHHACARGMGLFPVEDETSADLDRRTIRTEGIPV